MSDEDTSWDDRLRGVLTDEWQSSEHLAARLHAKPFTVLARLKDMMRRNLVERRLVKRAGQTTQVAQFRRTPL